jgi:hypothetical protein
MKVIHDRCAEPNTGEVFHDKCHRCGVERKIAGVYCADCKRDIADDMYLDYGSEYQGNEQADRAVQGEYAEMTEGDEYVEKSRQV